MRWITIYTILLLLFSPGAALAHGNNGVVVEQHHETVQAGPYTVHVGFSEWPLQAERSLDIIFAPADGITGKTGILTLVAPDGNVEREPLARFPRDRTVWGLDVRSLPLAGVWQLKFAIDGPLGDGEGVLAYLPVGPRPGPPIWLGWLIGLLPLNGLILLIVLAWRRVRPGRLAEATAWG